MPLWGAVAGHMGVGLRIVVFRASLVAAVLLGLLVMAQTRSLGTGGEYGLEGTVKLDIPSQKCTLHRPHDLCLAIRSWINAQLRPSLGHLCIEASLDLFDHYLANALRAGRCKVSSRKQPERCYQQLVQNLPKDRLPHCLRQQQYRA